MKRNRPPDNHADDLEEQNIIDQRLKRLFPSGLAHRKVPHQHQGTWCNQHGHVRLEPRVAHHFDSLSRSSTELGYTYLDPYEALYLLELKQLIIHKDEFQLSVAEAYQILLRKPADLDNYRVFSRLNNNGYFCLKPSSQTLKHLPVSRIDNHTETNYRGAAIDPSGGSLEVLFDICSSQRPFRDVLTDLQRLGPQVTTRNDLSDGLVPLSIHFEAYKRETFAKNKPRKGVPGKPDLFVVVRHKDATNAPGVGEMLNLESELGPDSMNKVLFAIVDSDGTNCFAGFSEVPSQRLTLRGESYQWFFELDRPQTPDDAASSWSSSAKQ